MKLVLDEKPSVAQSIAKVLGAAKREDGYLEGNGYVVSWCVGHLVELAQPEAYDDLPILPEHWKYQVSASTKKQFGILKKLMQDLENNAEVWCVMLELVQEIGTKLRTHKKKAGGIAISIRNNELFTKEWQCRISIPTQSPTYLAKTAFALFAKNYQWEHPICSVTVQAINLFEEDCPIQYDLFTDMKSLDRQERLDAAIEQIRFRFGKDAIKNGVLFQKSKMPTERKVDLVMPTGMIG